MLNQLRDPIHGFIELSDLELKIVDSTTIKIIISNNAAYIIKRINDVWGEKPGKKTLQKIVFLIEQKGVNLGYAYDHLENRSTESVISGVQKIKGSKYSEEHIRRSLENLNYFNKPLSN